MSDKKLIWTGGIGAAVAAVRCLTPVLVVLLTVLGLSAWVGWIDYLAFPSLAIFAGIMGYGLFLRRRRRLAACRHGKDVRSSERVR